MPVIFCGVARQGGIILAKRFDVNLKDRDRDEIEGVVRHSCPSSVRSGWSHKAQISSSSLYLASLGDTGALVCVAASDLSESAAWRLLRELGEEVRGSEADLVVSSTEGSLTKDTTVKDILFRAMKKDGSGDQLTKVQEKVDKVTEAMINNIQAAFNNKNKFAELEEITEGVARDAVAFEKASLELRNQARMRYLKMSFCAIATALCIVGYFVVGLLPEELGSGPAGDASD
jgi:hypothetical protein